MLKQLLHVENLDIFLAKNGAQPIPTSHWHLHMFALIFAAERFYPKVIQSLEASASDYKYKLSRAKMNALSFASLEHSFTLKSDPIRRSALAAFLNSIGGPSKTGFRALLSKGTFPAAWCPDTFVTEGGVLKGVFLGHADAFNADSVRNWTLTSWLRSIFSAEFGSHLQTKFVCLQDLVVNPDFYVHFDFRFEEDPEYLEAIAANIIRTQIDFFPQRNEELESKGLLPKPPVDLIDSCKTALKSVLAANLEAVQSRPDVTGLALQLENLFTEFGNISEHFDPHQYSLKLHQLYFYLAALNSKLFQSNWVHNECLSSLLERVAESLGSKGSALQERPLSIFGKRIAMDAFPLRDWNSEIGLDESAFDSQLTELKDRGITHPLLETRHIWSYEMLNPRLFSSPNYFFYRDWESLGESLGASQFRQNPDKQILSDFVICPRTLTPSASGRPLKKSPAVSMNWDRLVYRVTPDQQNQALELDDIAYGARSAKEDSLSQDDRFKLALSNVLWDLKMSNTPGDDLVRLFECDFWDKLVRPDMSQKGRRLDIDAECYNRSWLDSHSQPSLYSLKFDRFREMRKDILEWRQLVHEKIPDYFSKARDDFEREEIHRFADYAKRQYAQKLKDYKQDFLRRESFFATSKIQDFEHNMVTNLDKPYTPVHRQVPLSDRLLQTEQDIRRFSQNNLLKLALESRRRVRGEAGELARAWETEIPKQLFGDFVCILPEVVDCPIDSIFSEADFDRFAEIFPHSQLRAFGDYSVSDLLSFLNLAMSPTYIDIVEKLTLAEQLGRADPNVSARTLLHSELPTFNNVGKFLSVFTENYTTLLASNFDSQEKKDIVHLYGFKKERERNLAWTRADFASFEEFISGLPLLQSPYESIHRWIDLKERESHLRNATSHYEITGLTVSDGKMVRALSNRTWDRLNQMSHVLFGKDHHEVSTLELAQLTEHLLERLYLIKRNPPLNLFEILHFMLEHPNLHNVDRVNLLESLELFDMRLNTLHMGQVLAEFPLVHEDTSFISSRFVQMRLDEVVLMANACAVSHEHLYLADESASRE